MKLSSTKKLKFFGIILLVIITALLFTFYFPNNNEISYRTDIKPISNRFPKLKDIQKVYWSTNVIDDDFGPTSYWMRGYVFLDHASISDLKTTYTWETVNLKPKVEYDFNGKTQNWSYSEEFNNSIKNSNYVGQFYLDSNSDSLYFDIEQ